ncbi:hypothetical protein [Salinibacillus kushneri]|nr:hypothetical protein [Salinibacillus kushneri]
MSGTSIIDWDDITPNEDKAIDYSDLLWPYFQTKSWPDWNRFITNITDSENSERLNIYFRAKLFDEAIDVLADYIEAEEFKEVKDLTQERAKRFHFKAYHEYKEFYKT